jgi:hypothetical protein
MFGPSVTSGWRVRPISIVQIRSAAQHARKVLLRRDPPFFPMAEFIERLFEYAIVVDVVEREILPPGVDACCVPERAEISLSEETYAAACNDVPRARFTVIHELGHMILTHSRSFHRDNGKPIPAFEDSEWQADQFAAEFLMPLQDLRAKGIQNADAVMFEYHVSQPAARRRIKQLAARGEL